MIVVSDTTPLNYLVLTATVHVLPAISAGCTVRSRWCGSAHPGSRGRLTAEHVAELLEDDDVPA